ncbi:MAG: cytochrome c [candidate division NC10 bacterium]|nr:cytochrome c [candidate division NC10 bacterium]
MRGARFIACAGVLSVLFVVLTPHPGFPQQKGDPKAGKQRYGLLCSSCHGTTGKGDGPASAALTPKPQNHADGKHMNALTDKYQDIWNVVAYIRTLAVPPYKPAQ